MRLIELPGEFGPIAVNPNRVMIVQATQVYADPSVSWAWIHFDTGASRRVNMSVSAVRAALGH